MENKELEFYEKIGNWDFSQIKYEVKNNTNWDYLAEIKNVINETSKVLDLGTADGTFILENYPKCNELIGTDFSPEMIKSAKSNNLKYQRSEVKFKVMDNFKMDLPENYFDLVTARNTITDKKGIYKVLKPNGKLIIRGVDKLDCWNLKELFGYGQNYNNQKAISQIDYDEIVNDGFKDVKLISINIEEYYKTKEDLLALLLKTPILLDESWNKKSFDMNILDRYISENKTNIGIKLDRRYYGIIATK